MSDSHNDLKEKMNNLCTIGSRNIKLMLNKLIKDGDINAELYRLVLEIIDKDIQAKGISYYLYRDKVYVLKQRILNELVDKCKQYKIKYGISKNDENIICFELPKMKQLNFKHLFNDISDFPKYEKEIDEKSNLDKVEKCLMKQYKDLIEKRKKIK